MEDYNPGKVEDFLEKVDEIEALVKGLKSNDKEDVSKAMSRADEIIAEVQSKKQCKLKELKDNEEPDTNTGFNRTSINTAAAGDDDMPCKNDVNYEGMDQAGFMSAMEADAKERAARKNESAKIAEEFKEKGNKEFREGNYEAALELYTQGLREMRDNWNLYTNRAQTYIKLGRYDSAHVDCEWALKVYPNCIKAHVHMGRAHIYTKEYEEARECFHRALTCDPKKEALINDYLAEVDRKEVADQQEAAAAEMFKDGKPEDMGLVEVLKRVQNSGQLPVFYSGGFRILKAFLQDTTHRTLFRTNGGLELVKTMPVLQKCLPASPQSLSREELDMLAAAFDLFTEACRENDRSIEVFLQQENLTQYCNSFLGVKLKRQGSVVQHAITNCLFAISQTETGRRLIVTLFDLPKLLAAMFILIRTSTKWATTAANLLSNLAIDKKFKAHLRDKVDETVCPSFEKLLTEPSCLQVLPCCITMITNLSADKSIRCKLMKRNQLWEACTNAFNVHAQKLTEQSSVEIVESVLGLVLNLTMETSECVQTYGAGLCENCLAMVKTDGCPRALVDRGVAVLSHVLPVCSQAVDSMVEKGAAALMLAYLKENEAVSKAALKCLTIITQTKEAPRQYIVDNKGLGVLLKGLKHDDEIIVGNAALCLSHCTKVPKMCMALTKTDVIKDLLVLARDGRRPAVQQNCAILIAKLAYGDSKHLERLRELHGIEILHSCMKFVE